MKKRLKENLLKSIIKQILLEIGLSGITSLTQYDNVIRALERIPSLKQKGRGKLVSAALSSKNPEQELINLGLTAQDVKKIMSLKNSPMSDKLSDFLEKMDSEQRSQPLKVPTPLAGSGRSAFSRALKGG